MKKKPKKLTVRVTAKDIREGKAGDACRCPIAHAVRRVTGGRKVSVGLFRAYFGGVCFTLPRRAVCFVQDFDRRWPVKPFQFTVTL